MFKLLRLIAVRRQPWRFACVALPLMCLLYAIVFLPHAEDGVLNHALSAYLTGLARVSGYVILWFDSTVTVAATEIRGRFPLRIVLDCSALDAQCLYAAAVIAYPASLKRRVMGALIGCACIAVLNVLRIVALYFVGADSPSLFNVMHEEVLQVALVVLSLLAFWGWTFWASRLRNSTLAR